MQQRGRGQGRDELVEDRTPRRFQRRLDTIGADPHQVVAEGLRAPAAGRLYAVDTLHGRLAWGLGRAAPRAMARLAAIAGGFVPEA